MLVPNRNFQSPAYRYGFQGQEKDDEIKGNGNSLNYKFRMHDPRIGRFFAVDPLTAKYPYYTSYSFSGNKVIVFAELEGLEEGWVIDKGTVKKVEGPIIEAFDSERTAQMANSIGAQTPSDFSRRLRTYEFLRNQTQYPIKPSGTVKATMTAEEMINARPDMFPGVAGVMPGVEAVVFEQAFISAAAKLSKLRQVWKVSKLARKSSKLVNPGGDLMAGGEFLDDFARTYRVPATLKSPKITTSLDDILSSSSPVKNKLNAPEVYFVKKGNYSTAIKDFKSLEGLTDIKQITNSKFEGMVGKLKDGRTVSVRTGSSGGVSGKSLPTLQINPAKGTIGKRIKIRYE